jgi:predicted small lipoprotein YifL
MRVLKMLLAGALLATAVACGDEGGATVPPPDAGTPGVTWLGLMTTLIHDHSDEVSRPIAVEGLNPPDTDDATAFDTLLRQ